MNTDAFIRDLSKQLPPRPPRRMSLLWAALLGLAVASVAFLAFSGARPDLGEAQISTALKAGFGMVVALAAIPLVLRASAPNISVRAAGPPLYAALALAVMATAIGLAAAPEGLRWTLWTGGGVPDCLGRIPLIALPIGAALFFAARRFGPTRLGVAGLALGATAGALAAIPYSLFCPIDFAPYVATWYSAAIILCAAAGALVGPRLLRW